MIFRSFAVSPLSVSASYSSSVAALSHLCLPSLRAPSSPRRKRCACTPPADPSPRVRGMVEALLLRQLAGRRLLPGNVVALPMFGQQALFAVEQVDTAAGQASGQPAGDQAAAAGGPSARVLPPPVGASTVVHLLLGSEAAPKPTAVSPQLMSSDRNEDWPALAAEAAARALGCSPEDPGPVAARRAAAAGLASRGITFGDLGGTVLQVGAEGWGAAAPRSTRLWVALQACPLVVVFRPSWW